MALIPGTNIASRIAPFDTADTLATHDSQWGRGGHREVTTIAERDAITTERRKEGMTVWVKDTDKTYQLYGGITNSDWRIYNSGGAAVSGKVTCTTTDFVYIVSSTSVTEDSIILATLKCPTTTSVHYICSVTDIISGSFALVLSNTPDVTGYSINWLVQNP